MITFFKTPQQSIIATESNHPLTAAEVEKLCWLYGGATLEEEKNLTGQFIGPRREMITPWSTNAVEITQNMAIEGISRIEEYYPVKDENADYDPMLQRLYHGLNQDIFTINKQPEPIISIENLDEGGTCKSDFHVGIKVYDFLYFSTPSRIAMHLVQKQMGATHQVELLGKFQQGVVGEVHAVHYAVKCLSRTDAVILFNVLPDEGRFANAT